MGKNSEKHLNPKANPWTKRSYRQHIVIITIFSKSLKGMVLIIPPLGRRGGCTVLLVFVSPSVLLSVTSIFHLTFLSNHASQPLQTWYGSLTRGLTLGLQNSDPPLTCFLFYDLHVAYFPTKHGNMANFRRTLGGILSE